jgi:hypothetical protein
MSAKKMIEAKPPPPLSLVVSPRITRVDIDPKA